VCSSDLDIFTKNSGYLEQINSQKSGRYFSVKNCHIEILLNYLVPWIVDVGVREYDIASTERRASISVTTFERERTPVAEMF
jgi:hypothetical protein